MSTRELGQRLLDTGRAFPQAVIAAIREHGARAVVQAVSRTIDVPYEITASVLADALEGEGSEDLEEALRAIAALEAGRLAVR